jgi:hypothetical protein
VEFGLLLFCFGFLFQSNKEIKHFQEEMDNNRAKNPKIVAGKYKKEIQTNIALAPDLLNNSSIIVNEKCTFQKKIAKRFKND